MLAIDTNIVVRYLTGDHPSQSAAARSVVDGHDVFVGDTVLLETDSVLRSTYGFDQKRICAALGAFVGLPRVVVEDPGRLARALDDAARGVDFADALHLARSSGCDAFLTFDRKLIRRAASTGSIEVRHP